MSDLTNDEKMCKMSLAQEITSAIQDTIGRKSTVLHEPKFSGNESKYTSTSNLFPSVNFGIDMAIRSLYQNLKNSTNKDSLEKENKIKTYLKRRR